MLTIVFGFKEIVPIDSHFLEQRHGVYERLVKDNPVGVKVSVLGTRFPP